MIFDLHGDIITDIYDETTKGNTNSFRTKHYPKYILGNVVQSIYVNWTDPNKCDQSYFDAVFDIAIAELNRNNDIVSICFTYDDLIHANNQNKLGIILGIEGVKYLSEPEDIIELYHKGIRHVGLTWNEANSYAGGVSFPEQGLTDKGRRLLQIVQDLHMIIDLSHANPKSFDEILDATKGPIIISHGNVKALCDHPRNYTDEQLLKIKSRNGVVGLCAVANFISKDPELQTITYLAKHIDYLVKLIGIDHVGLGLDVCYYLYEGKTSTGVKGLETIAEAKNIIAELKLLGYNDHEIDKITHLNFQRVIKEVLR